MSLYHLSDHSLIKISGKEAESFLQGQLTCDIKPLLTTNQAQITAHCNRQGRMVSLFDIFYYEDAFYLILSNDICTATIANLKKYSVFSKTVIEPIPATCYASDLNQTFPELVTISLAYSSAAYYISFTDNNALPAVSPAEAWHYSRLAQGIARLYSDTIGSFLPHEINLPELGGVSFNKGCYIGQEIVARFEHRSKLRYKLKSVTLPSNHNYSLGDLITIDDINGILLDALVNNECVTGLISSKTK